MAKLDEAIRTMNLDQDRRLLIQPGQGAEITFHGRGHGFAFNAILLYLPNDVVPYFAIDRILIGGKKKNEAISGGQLIVLGENVSADIRVLLWNTSDQAQHLRAVLWIRYQDGSLIGEAIGWDGYEGLGEFAAWLGGARSGHVKPGQSRLLE